MPEDYYSKYRYSITCKTEDLALVHCLRALCQFAEEASYKQIGWGGTGTSDWKKADNKITLRFTNPNFRDKFIETASRVLPDNSWSVVNTDDNNPAKRQRKK